MRFIFSLLATIAGFYSLLIFIRIIISWVRGPSIDGEYPSKPVVLLRSVTDPYLDWWRRNLRLQLGILDLSPLAGIIALSVLQTIFYSLANFGRVTLGAVLAVILSSLWSVTAFLLILCFIVMILRMVMYLTNRDIYSPFWRAVDMISQPILYRINRIFFGNKIANYMKGLVVSSAALLALRIIGGILIPILIRLLAGLPI